MRNATLTIATLVLAFGATGCQHRGLGMAGSRNHSFHGSVLITDFRQDFQANKQIALVHVLFVPEHERPKNSGGGTGTSNGGSVNHSELRVHLLEFGKPEVDSQPVTIEKSTTVQGGGSTFPLAQGNIFVALVHGDGSLDLSQVPHVERDAEATPESILQIIKNANPRNARIQAVS